ncbi:hypothetical protein J6590_048283 [Homalodisca vitripennis]|nr:hypothetical protein J6590_048283 [Homalodisca vitripennis]
MSLQINKCPPPSLHQNCPLPFFPAHSPLLPLLLYTTGSSGHKTHSTCLSVVSPPKPRHHHHMTQLIQKKQIQSQNGYLDYTHAAFKTPITSTRHCQYLIPECSAVGGRLSRTLVFLATRARQVLLLPDEIPRDHHWARICIDHRTGRNSGHVPVGVVIRLEDGHKWINFTTCF